MATRSIFIDLPRSLFAQLLILRFVCLRMFFSFTINSHYFEKSLQCGVLPSLASWQFESALGVFKRAAQRNTNHVNVGSSVLKRIWLGKLLDTFFEDVGFEVKDSLSESHMGTLTLLCYWVFVGFCFF